MADDAINTSEIVNLAVTEAKLAQAVVDQLGVAGPAGPAGPPGDVTTVLGDGEGLISVSIDQDLELGTVAANRFGLIPGQFKSGWDDYDWVDFVAVKANDDIWSGRIRVNNDPATWLGTSAVGASDLVTAEMGAHQAFRSLDGDLLVFTTSNLAANLNIYVGSPTTTLTGVDLYLWGLTEGTVSTSVHELTTVEAVSAGSDVFGTVSGRRMAQAVNCLPSYCSDRLRQKQGVSTSRRGWTAMRVRSAANAAIDTRIVTVEHHPPAPTAANANAIVKVSSTGDMFAQRQEEVRGTPSTVGGWEQYFASDYLGAFLNPPAVQTGKKYYNIGLRLWFQAVAYGGQTRWQAGGEPVAWRGYATSENAAAANNIDASGDLVYIANLYRVERATGTFTEGSSASTHRTWENQRDGEL